MKWLCLLSALLLFTSCEKEQADQKNQEVGKYVYVDAAGTVHIDKECLKKNMPKTGLCKEAQLIMMQGMRYVDRYELHENDYRRYCPNCVSDKAYEKLQSFKEKPAAY